MGEEKSKNTNLTKVGTTVILCGPLDQIEYGHNTSRHPGDQMTR